ncbi:transcription factor HES-5-like [Rhinatrema bivittatum]|uniref:transcription factor HES-5-like n=1 Tax=Rhinatrema bivittatum TaxID=194408 RepID=UPI0011271F09|nr:transcription factor HES-5-like [Rhinatrema bivittatum]
MAPYSDFMGLDKLTSKEKNKLRKPVVEKMRRDRINSSIEQLKLLLERELRGQQPNAKLEKADILEMAVTYLQLHSRPQIQAVISLHKNTQMEFKEGYSRCFEEVLHFLSFQKVQTDTQAKLLDHFQMSQSAAAPELPGHAATHSSSKPTAVASGGGSSSSPFWRPW